MENQYTENGNLWFCDETTMEMAEKICLREFQFHTISRIYLPDDVNTCWTTTTNEAIRTFFSAYE